MGNKTSLYNTSRDTSDTRLFSLDLLVIHVPGLLIRTAQKPAFSNKDFFSKWKTSFFVQLHLSYSMKSDYFHLNSKHFLNSEIISFLFFLTNEFSQIFQIFRQESCHNVNKIMICSFCPLTLSTPYILQSCIKMKNNLNFYFHPSLWCLKRFESLQKSVKIKISVNFLSTRIGTGGIKN